MPARKPRLLPPTPFLVGAGLIFVAGCSSNDAVTVAVTHPTMIEVAPESFLGDVPCATDGPGLKRYVATLFDENRVVGAGGASGDPSEADGEATAEGEFRLPSSPPTPCRTPVGFGFVVAGRQYRAEIEGYDTDELSPRALGSREMKVGDKLVQPTWRATCARAIAVDTTIIRADRCDKRFESQAPDANGSVTIKLAGLLGNLRCGSEPGEVDHFEVSLGAAPGAEPQVQSVPCTDDARATFDDLTAGQAVSAYVTAFSADATSAFAGASCSARTLPGSNIDAACSALNQTGTLRVDLAAALALLDLTCNAAKLSRIEIRVPGEDGPQVVTPPACLQPFDRGFPAGAAALTVTALRGNAAALEELGSVTCHAEVTPGQLIRAQCEPNNAN